MNVYTPGARPRLRTSTRACVFGLALLVHTGVARAETSVDANAPAHEGAAPDLTEVKSIYEQGKAKFDTFDYGGAVDLWTQAYAKLGDSAEERQIKNALVYNIATAQERAYELEHDVTRLRQAIALLRKYVTEYKSLYQATPEGREEVARVEARIAELEQRIATAEAESPTPASPSPPGEPVAQDQPPPPVNPERQHKLAVRQLLRTDPVLAQQYRSARGMIIGGSVLLGIGAVVLFTVTVPAALVTYESEGRRRVLIGSGVAGTVLAAGGGILLGFGIPLRRKTQAAAEAQVAWAPVLSPTEAGMRIALRF